MLVLVLGENTCIPGEYNHEGECCPKCVSGKVVKTHCTKTTSTVCIPCVDNTYMDHPNGEIKCLRCKTCDKGAGLITIKKCTYTSNTECGCEDGSFCPVANAIECDMCQKHKKCQAGEEVKSNGTKLKDTECEKCREGTFSNDTMTHCAAWTKCLEGKRVKMNGNSTHDTICKELSIRNRTLIAISVLFPAAFIVYTGCDGSRHSRDSQVYNNI
uniref:TNFR-Cys domain-containing protein n=1 Tax=Leptobrachium leishanense TaxID=445787 RepID=A0A8C5Q0F5_9ANUR